MTITRRGFLKSMLALGAAPAIVRAESLMKLWVPPQDIVLPDWTPAVVTPTDITVAWNAQIEESPISGQRIFSAFVSVNGGPLKRMSMSADIPAGVAPRMEIRSDGTLDIVGGINKTSWETEFPTVHEPTFLGEGCSIAQGDTISQQVQEIPRGCVYYPGPAGQYVATPSHASQSLTGDLDVLTRLPARRVRNALLDSSSFCMEHATWTKVRKV